MLSAYAVRILANSATLFATLGSSGFDTRAGAKNTVIDISLSPELRKALADHPGEPVELIDEVSRARFVLLPAEQFDRIKALLTTDEFEIGETYAAQSGALTAAGWDDPELDIYNDYNAHQK